MDYQNFLYAVEREINQKLNKGTKAKVYETLKNNGLKRRGITIVQEGLNIGPTIYLEEFYERYQQGETMEHLLEELMQFYETVKCTQQWDCRKYQSFDENKEKLAFKVINYEKNKELLENMPFFKILDLAIVFYVLLEIGDRGMATIAVNQDHLDLWQVSKEQLYNQAMSNVKTLLPAQFYTMHQAIAELKGEQEQQDTFLQTRDEEFDEEIMFILTNTYRNYGAASMAYPHVLEMIGNMLGEDFYILPSSVHEVIVVPASKSMSEEAFRDMIVEINETQVSPEEVLSNHPYYYNVARKELSIQRQVQSLG